MAKTLDMDASLPAHLYDAANQSSGVSADGDQVLFWDDVGDATSLGAARSGAFGATTGPFYRDAANGVNGLSVVEFTTDGGNQHLVLSNEAGSGFAFPVPTLDDVVNADAGTMLLVFRVDGDAFDGTPASENPILFGAGLGGWTAFVQTEAGGQDVLHFQHTDATSPAVLSVDIPRGAPVVALLQHGGGNISLSINGGSAITTASGNTAASALADNCYWGFNWVEGRALTFTLMQTTVWDTGDADGNAAGEVAAAILKWTVAVEQKMTQIVALFGTDRYATAPPSISACTGGGTVASGSNPSDGTSLATATAIFPWVETTINSTAYAWGQAADNKGSAAIRPLVKEFGPIRRRLSDPRGGYVGSSQDITLLDDGGVIAGIYASQSWIRKTVHTYVQDVAGIGTGTKQRRFRGYIRSLKHEGGNRYRMTVEDVLSFYFSKNGQERKIPQTPITVVDGNADPGVRSKCAPVLMGSLSSASDTVPDGVVEFEFVKTETLDPPNDVLGNLHTHLIGIRPIGDTQAVFMGDPSGNPPTVRSQVAAGEYGTRVYAPGQSGYPTAAVYQVRDGKRWAFLYVDQNHPGADAARYGRIPITGDVCGREDVGDGTGDTFDLLPYQYMHILDVEVFQSVGDDDNPSLLTLDGYTILNHASFVAVDGIQDTRLSGGAPGAFSLGHGGRQITLRQFIKQANVSGDWDTAIDHHGRVMIDMLDRSDAYASAPVFTEGLNILDGTFRVEDDGSDRVANKVTAKYKRRYKRSLQQPTTLLEGSRGPREPFDPDFDGLYENEDTTAQQDLGTVANPEIRELELELELVRDDDWAEDVVDNQLDMWKSASGRPTVSFDVLYRDGVSVEIGGVISVTHSEAPAPGGWTLQRLRVVGIDDYPGERITFYALYVDDLLP